MVVFVEKFEGIKKLYRQMSLSKGAQTSLSPHTSSQGVPKPQRRRTCPEHLPREATGVKHMPKTPQLVHLNVLEQQIYSELLLSERASHFNWEYPATLQRELILTAYILILVLLIMITHGL